ncbi:ABC transporter ATP-binding protein/permease [Priestia flexa]|uniref:ABC transporter ATP-binding protein/permease n=1 Tax=Priestia flexa TaxID=86664 RepID=UPI002E204BC3|nr:ABC transporter ATP-binding protein/permease [Priestia flexa]
MLEVIELSKAYKKAKVVNNISLFLERGETIGLLGPNGAGKSTTISLISSLIKRSSGDIRINGKSSVEDPIHMRQILGVVPQELALYDELTARENLDFFGRTQRMKGKQLAEKVDEILNMISLTDRQHDRVKIFSGGMKRRLNIGIAQYQVLIPLLAVSMAMIGGAYWPLEIVTSPVMLTLSKFVPLTYGMDLLKQVVLYDYAWQKIAYSSLLLCIITVVLMALGINILEKKHT